MNIPQKNLENLLRIKTYLLSAALFFTLTSQAFSADKKNETIKLTSNSALYKYQANKTICTYHGNAKFIQGETILRAKKISIQEKEGNKIEKIVASGKNSSYSTRIKDKQKINASANLITIDPEKNNMVLTGDGRLIVGKDKYSGPHITYIFE